LGSTEHFFGPEDKMPGNSERGIQIQRRRGEIGGGGKGRMHNQCARIPTGLRLRCHDRAGAREKTRRGFVSIGRDRLCDLHLETPVGAGRGLNRKDN